MSMAMRKDNLFTSMLAALPGWIMLVCGTAMVVVCLLGQSWLEQQRLMSHLQLIQQQARQMERQQVSYREFHQALKQQDPLLLERLAFYHLRLKPLNTQTLGPIKPLSPIRPTLDLTYANAQPPLDMGPRSIEELLYEPVSSENDIAMLPGIPDTWLMRLILGDWRPVSIVVGLIVVYMGLIWPTRTHKREAAMIGADARIA